MRYLILFFTYLCIAIPVHAESINAGFVQGLWYSSDEIIEGVPIRIYAAFRNNTPHDLTGTIRFMDNGERIGSSPVNALSGRLVETWIDWVPDYGEHSLTISLSEAELHVIGGETIKADVTGTEVTDTRLADKDSDSDGVGNQKDTDDDNDSILDEDEIARGTNPLIANPKSIEVPEVETPIEPSYEVAASTTDTEGLEQYLSDGISETLLSNVTEKVETAKESIDSYREKRNADIAAENIEPASIEANNATITRSSIEPRGTLLHDFISGVRALIANVYTFILWILSQVLGHPALVQIALLVGILYMFYRTARKLGRRPHKI